MKSLLKYIVCPLMYFLYPDQQIRLINQEESSQNKNKTLKFSFRAAEKLIFLTDG